MALSEEDKQRIEEEEKYRASLQQKKGNSKAKGCLTIIVILFVLGIIGMLLSPSSNDKEELTNTNNVTTPKSAEEAAVEEEARLKKVVALGNTICKERSSSVPYMDLETLAKYIDGTKTSEDRLINTAKAPSAASCEKVAELCLTVWSEDDCQKVAEKKIWIGMNNLQLSLSWGVPDDVNNTVGAWGTHSQWVYGDFGPYVYLEGENENDMLVTSWQD